MHEEKEHNLFIRVKRNSMQKAKKLILILGRCCPIPQRATTIHAHCAATLCPKIRRKGLEDPVSLPPVRVQGCLKHQCQMQLVYRLMEAPGTEKSTHTSSPFSGNQTQNQESHRSFCRRTSPHLPTSLSLIA